jgi:hypothetical protein
VLEGERSIPRVYSGEADQPFRRKAVLVVEGLE